MAHYFTCSYEISVCLLVNIFFEVFFLVSVDFQDSLKGIFLFHRLQFTTAGNLIRAFTSNWTTFVQLKIKSLLYFFRISIKKLFLGIRFDAITLNSNLCIFLKELRGKFKELFNSKKNWRCFDSSCFRHKKFLLNLVLTFAASHNKL
jgi:predicted membrane protein